MCVCEDLPVKKNCLRGMERAYSVPSDYAFFIANKLKIGFRVEEIARWARVLTVQKQGYEF